MNKKKNSKPINKKGSKSTKKKAPKKPILGYVFVALAFVAVVGGITWAVLQKQSNMEANTVIELNGETSKTLKAELTDFYPGSEQEYKIVLTGETAGNYIITLDFRDVKNSGSLENYLTATIKAKDITIQKQLKELLDGEEIELGKGVGEITIVYAMPTDTGNEAQGTTADFYIDLTAKNDKK